MPRSNNVGLDPRGCSACAKGEARRTIPVMDPGADAAFPQRFKVIVDRICATEQINRAALAKDLGASVHTISMGAYRGEIGFDLVARIALRAGVEPEEIDAIELAWLRMRATRPREEALRRALRRKEKMEEIITDMSRFAEVAGVGADFHRFVARKRAAVARANWQEGA